MKDAKGHGSDKRSDVAPMAPQSKMGAMAKMAPMAKQAPMAAPDSRVRGAAVGDHQAEQPANPALRNVPGHGIVPASAPVAQHNYTPSVGTRIGGVQSVGSRLTQNARERVAIGRGVDARHGNR
jgi:hypothetical protein